MEYKLAFLKDYFKYIPLYKIKLYENFKLNMNLANFLQIDEDMIN